MKKILLFICSFVAINTILAQQYDPITQMQWQNVGIFYTGTYVKLPGGSQSTSGGIAEAYNACVAEGFTSCNIVWSSDLMISSPVILSPTTGLYMLGNGHTAHCTNTGSTYCFTVNGTDPETSPALNIIGVTFDGTGATGSGVLIENYGEWEGDGPAGPGHNVGSGTTPILQITANHFSNVANGAIGLNLTSVSASTMYLSLSKNYNGLQMNALNSGGLSNDIITLFISDGGDQTFTDKNGVALALNGSTNGMGQITFQGGVINGNFGTFPIQLNAQGEIMYAIKFDQFEIEFNGDGTAATRIISLNAIARNPSIYNIKFDGVHFVGSGGGPADGGLGYLFTSSSNPQSISNIYFENTYLPGSTYVGTADSTLTGYVLGSYNNSVIAMSDFNTFFHSVATIANLFPPYAYVARAATTAISPQTLTTVTTTSTYLFSFSINCDTAVSGATIQGNITFTDPSGTVQTRQTGIATCTTLGTSSYSGATFSQSILTGTVITASSTISGSPNYDYAVTAQQVTAN